MSGAGSMLLRPPTMRDLDALIAEKVMGYVWSRSETAPAGWAGPNGDLLAPWRWLVRSGSRGYVPVIGGESRFIDNLRHFSTDIRAAWEVVELLNRKGRWPQIQYGPNEDGFESWHVELVNPCDVKIAAETAPLAICLAALKAVES